MKTTAVTKVWASIGLFLALFLAVSTAQAQELKVKGIVKGKSEFGTEILSEVNVFLQGTRIGVATDKKGEFTFPRMLKAGDVLVFSYLGYKKKSYTIGKATRYLNIVLVEDDNTILGATQSNKRYQSKRPKN